MITKKLNRKFSYQLFCHLSIVILLTFSWTVPAQVDKEALAKLYFEIESNSDHYFEGFKSIKTGSFSPYQSHRSGISPDSAFVSRTTGSEKIIEWNTDIIPDNWKGESASFIWICGFGNNLGNAWFDLDINDSSAAVSFSTRSEGHWSVFGSKGINLSFTAAAQNSNGANLGYMVLTVDQTFIKEGKSLTIRLSGKIIEKEIWYRLFSHSDVLSYIEQKMKRKVISDIRFINMGDAVLNLYASRKLSGSPVRLYNSEELIAEDELELKDEISGTTIVVPRILQQSAEGKTIIRISGEPFDTLFWEDINKQRIIAFMDENIEFERYVFPPGEFPAFRWKNEIMVENEIGKIHLNAIYFDKDFKQVSAADNPGRYGAVVEGKTSSGFIIKRFFTLFCSRAGFDDYSGNTPIRFNKLEEYDIADTKWEKYYNNQERFSFGSMKYFPQQDPDAAIFLAGLNDLDEKDIWYNTPRIKDRQWWITLKRKIEGIPLSENPLKTPIQINDDRLTRLNDGIADPDSYSNADLENIRAVCRKWAEKGGEPNITLIVHRGEIIFFEAFGEDENGKPLGKDSEMWMASITKILTGILMMQFVDQGIVDLDDPVDRYLPELSGAANKELTLRHLFTHTSGMGFAGEWASDWNIALENQIAQLIPAIEIGESFTYHRAGYALAGRIMERITGMAIPYLFQDYLFSPIGMNSARSDNTYGGLYCSAFDLARLGQMLLNKGSYNGFRLISEGTFELMLPQKLPAGDRKWGIGLTEMSEHGLGKSAFGHGAASGGVFRIDPENEIIIISARNAPGKYFNEFESKLIEACVKLVVSR